MADKQYNGIKIADIAKGKADFYLYTDLCKGCGLCLAKCPLNKDGKNGCLHWSKETGLFQTPAVEPDAATCTGCGTCALVCPDSAIRIERK